MKDRIKQLRKELGLSQDDFAKNLGLKSRGKIANIEFGKIEPDDDFAKKTLVKFAKLDERQWRIINDLIDSLQKNL